MTSPEPSFEELLHRPTAVAARPCSGPTGDGAPRHPRPAHASLRLSDAYAVDYGVRGPDGALIDLELAPLLDLIAASYAGCDSCAAWQHDLIGADPALTVHIVGVALRVLSGGYLLPADFVKYRLGDYGAGIALTMRHHGLPAAVRTAAAMPAEHRRSAAGTAAGYLLPSSSYGMPLSNFYEHGGHGHAGDAAELAELRREGHLPA